MQNVKKMNEKLLALKNESQKLIDSNKLDEAEVKNQEIKILNAQIEIQEKLDLANEKIENLESEIVNKDEEILKLSTDLEAVNLEKEDLMTKYTEASDKIVELTDKVNEMQPIVDEYNEKQLEEELSKAKDNYEEKFEQAGGEDAKEVFESEEVQNLIRDTINKDNSIAIKAKYELGEKVLNILKNNSSKDINISNIQEPATQNKNLNKEADEFKSIYGFEKQ